jgi:hypothetical protein
VLDTVDGSPHNLHVWCPNFRAFYMQSDFPDVIQQDPEPKLSTESNSTKDNDTDKCMRQKLARQKIEMAISRFTIAFMNKEINNKG